MKADSEADLLLDFVIRTEQPRVLRFVSGLKASFPRVMAPCTTIPGFRHLPQNPQGVGVLICKPSSQQIRSTLTLLKDKLSHVRHRSSRLESYEFDAGVRRT